jgi:hypothetical protein
MYLIFQSVNEIGANNMQTSRIYHGGSTSKRKGWPGGGSGSSSYNYDRIWIPSDDLFGYPNSAPNGPSTRTLPNGVAVRVWTFSPSETDIVFCWFGLPSKFWKYLFATGSSELTVMVYYYVDSTVGAPNNVIDFRLHLAYVRHNEDMNFVVPALTGLTAYSGTQFYNHVNTTFNFGINDVSGAGTEIEGSFYLKLERQGGSPSDTYPNEAHLYGIGIDFPLKFP